MAEEEFYVYILPEETNTGITYEAWVFRQDCGIALCAFGVSENDLETVSAEYIRELDDAGYFDDDKVELLSYE